MALHDPPLQVRFIDERTGLVSRPWAEWLIIVKRDKIDVVDSATDGNIATFDEDGNIEDANSSLSSIITDISDLQAADVLIQADIDALESADVVLEAEDLASEARSYFYALNI